MGLDMYLSRYPRYKDLDGDQISAVEDYFSWEERGEEYKDSDLKEWCGRDWCDLPDDDAIEFYRPYWHMRYSDWDTEKQFGWKRIHESVGYWRKANAIHGWFVENVQDGEDDCHMHREVTADDLIQLKDLCVDVLEHSVMALGKLHNGYHLENGKRVDDYVDGKVILNPEYAEDRLPICKGFFFGNDQYNEWYLEELKETIGICNSVLDETDFEKQVLYYCSSW
jgi:hypothetical protein